MKIDTNKKDSSNNKKMVKAKKDYNKLMSQIEPFIQKSDIIITSTEGKWYDTTSTSEKTVQQNFVYR